MHFVAISFFNIELPERKIEVDYICFFSLHLFPLFTVHYYLVHVIFIMDLKISYIFIYIADVKFAIRYLRKRVSDS